MRPTRTDVAIALAVAVPTGLDAWWNEAGTRQADLASYALVLLPAAALLVRRRWPVAVAVFTAVALVAWYAIGHRGELTGLPAMVALYTVAVSGNPRRSLFAGGVTAVVAAALAIMVGDAGLPVDQLGLPLAAILLGEVVRGQREQRLAEQRGRAQRERLHLARELHDVVAHTVAAIQIQSSVAADAFDRRPELAREALGRVRELGRHAMTELRATLAVLREDTPAEVTQPMPGLADLPALVDQIAGVAVVLRCDAVGAQVPVASQLAAYRIVQEALTNVLRHARARHAEVHVCDEPGGLSVRIVDDGVGWADGGRPGLGLTGMAERAAGIGGTVEWGPRPEGGFAVQATLPAIGSA